MMAKSASSAKSTNNGPSDTSSATTEVLFYHLEHFPLERVLPMLVEKTIERGWRALIQASSMERVETINTLLWTYKDDSFLPHGTAKDAHPAEQPVLLTTSDDNLNGASVRFQIDGTVASELTSYTRVVYLFDGFNKEALTTARQQWTVAKDAGCSVTYWQQSQNGRWEKKA